MRPVDYLPGARRELNQSLDQSAKRASHQFSVRSLLVLVVVVSVILTIMRLSRGSEVFGALASPWTWISFALIGAAWLTVRRSMHSPHRLVGASILTYAVSMIVPALEMGDELAFGFIAWLQSYAFGYGYVVEFFDPPNASGQWPQIQIDARLPFACLLGLVANSLVILGWIAFYVARYRRRGLWVSRWFAWSAFGFMLVCIIPIALAAGLRSLYPGFAMWTVSALLLARGAGLSSHVAP